MLYDLFLSHSHADKVWTRALFESLSSTDYDGRNLRAWLDARVLDPGNLSSARELESALDRSHRLVLVLSPDALASSWVQHELAYFTRTASIDRVIVLKHRACTVPPAAVGCACIDWTGDVHDGAPLAALLERLRPHTDEMRRYLHCKAVRRAFGNARSEWGNDFDARSTASGEALLSLLLKPQLQNLDEEGLALAGFDAAGQAMAELDDNEGYMMRLLLGEILAEAQLRDPNYAQVAARYVDLEVRAEAQPSFLTWRNRALAGKSAPRSDTNLFLTIARAASKLAELDAACVDLSTLAAVLYRLDGRPAMSGPAKSVAMMVGRTLGKLRGSPQVDAMINALSEWGGNASHIALAAAVSCTFDQRNPLVYTTDEFQQRVARLGRAAVVPRPGQRIARLLMEPLGPVDLNLEIEPEIRTARDDYIRAFGAWEAAEGDPWCDLHDAPPLTHLCDAPLVGTARRIHLHDMEFWTHRLGPTDIACLTEPRIVDALLDSAGGFLIDEAQAAAPLGVRLKSRGVRFATCTAATMARVADGTALVWWPHSDGTVCGYSVEPAMNAQS